MSRSGRRHTRLRSDISFSFIGRSVVKGICLENRRAALDPSHRFAAGPSL